MGSIQRSIHVKRHMLVSKNVAEEPYYESAAPLFPADPSLESLRESAKGCRACHLWRHATQTVFGEGPQSAQIVFVGEQPGDKEDLQGRPFVGPAGQLFEKSLEEAGIPRAAVYITNVVKHFKWVPSGPRRLHQKPNRQEVTACRPWLEAELAVLEPQVLVCLGATAAQAILGPDFRLTKHRGEFVPSPYRAATIATLHPSAILRAFDAASRERDLAGFVADLRMVAAKLA